MTNDCLTNEGVQPRATLREGRNHPPKYFVPQPKMHGLQVSISAYKLPINILFNRKIYIIRRKGPAKKRKALFYSDSKTGSKMVRTKKKSIQILDNRLRKNTSWYNHSNSAIKRIKSYSEVKIS